MAIYLIKDRVGDVCVKDVPFDNEKIDLAKEFINSLGTFKEGDKGYYSGDNNSYIGINSSRVQLYNVDKKVISGLLDILQPKYSLSDGKDGMSKSSISELIQSL